MVYVMMDSIKYKLQAVHRLNVIIGILSLLLILLSSIGLSAQDTYSIKYTIEDGLPSNEVYDIETDSEGKIWYTTDRGIGHFDGYEFVNYTTADGIGDNVNFEIYKDWFGRLWFTGYNKTITVWDGSSFVVLDDFIEFIYNKKASWVRMIEQVDSSKYILGLNGVKKELILFDYIKEVDEVQLDIEEEVAEKYRRRFVKKVINRIPNYFLNFGDGRVSYVDDLLIVDYPEYNFADTIKLKGSIEEVSYLPSSRELLVSTMNGLCIIDLSSKKKEELLESHKVTNSLVLNCNSIWVSTLSNGIIVMPNQKVEMYRLLDEDIKLINIEIVDDFVLVSTGVNSVYASSRKDMDFSLLTKDTDEESTLYLTKNSRRNTVESSKGYEYYTDRGQLKYTKVPYSSFTILDDEGVYFWNGASVNRKNGIDSIKLYTANRTNCVVQGDDEKVYVGTREGLKYWTDKGVQDAMEVQNMNVNKIINTKGIFGLSTKGSGIWLLNNDEWFSYGAEDGLNSDFIEELEVVDRYKFVLLYNNGLQIVEIDSVDNEITSIVDVGTHEGLPVNEMVDIKVFSDTLYALTNSEIFTVPMKLIGKDTSAPSLSFDYVVASNSEVEEMSDVRLAYDQNDITIGVKASPFFRNTKGARFRYRLNSGDDLGAWVNTNVREAIFDDLSPGNYVVDFNARNALGAWDSNHISYQFEILPHFTNTFWFRTLVVLSVFLAVSFYYYLRWIRMNRLQEAQRRANVAELRARKSEIAALRNQMNPHFIYNTLNSLQNFIFKQDPITSNKVLTKFSRMVRNSLRFASLASVSLKDELSFIKDYLELEIIRFPDRFEYRIDHDELSKEESYIPTLILQPLIENCIRHGFRNIDYKGLIEINMTAHHKDYTKIRIIDNGMGSANANKRFEESNKLSHQIVRDRVELLRSGGYEHTSFRILSLDAGYGVELILPSNNLN